MLARTPAFDRAFKSGAKPIVRCDILRNFAIRKSNVLIEEGEITIDLEAARRRTFAGVITDEDGTLEPSRPPRATDLILPYGNELAVHMGFEGTELLPVGVFRIQETTRVRDTNSYRIDAVDRSEKIAAARFETPYAIRTGWLLTEALPVLLGDRYPGLQFEIQTTSTAKTEQRPDVEVFDDDGNVVATHGDPTPIIVYEAGDDPWAQASRLASRFGLDFGMDARGICVIRDAPRAVGSAPAWTYSVDDPDSVLMDGMERWTSRDKTNVAHSLSEGSGVDEPLRASAQITDPNHVLYPTGELGRRPAFARGTYKDQARTQEVANATVAAGSSNVEILAFEALAHPAHEAGDTVQIDVPGIGSHLCLISSWNLDITGREVAAFATVTSRPAELEEPPTP